MKNNNQDFIDTKPEVMKAARYMRTLISVGALSLPLAFVWLKLQGVNFAPIAQNITADVIFKFTLAIYYFCWVWGLSFDTANDEVLFVKSPDRLHVYIGGTLIALLITGMFAVLCYVDTWRKFSIFLAIYLAINIISWLYLIKFALNSTFQASQESYRQMKKYIKLEQLNLVFNTYLCGKWQWARFLTGGLIVALMNWLSFRYRNGASVIQIGTYSLEVELLIALTILLFVTIMELWIWYMRLKVKAGLQILEDLQDDYRFEPIE
jgi:hypothetical protein